MNIFFLTLIIFVLVYLILNWFAKTSSKKISKGIRSFTIILSIILAVVMVYAGRFIFSLPFVELSTTNKVATGSVLYGASYIFIFAGFGFLDREFVNKLKSKWKSFRSSESSIES